MAKIAIVYHSGYGHTARQAEAVATGARDGGGEVTVLKVDDLVDADAPGWATLDAADAIVFGAPTYMGGASAQFKTFVDATSKRWFTSAWKDKIAAGFTNSSAQSGDKVNTLIGFVVLAMQHGMIWVGQDLLPGNNTTHGSVDDLNRLGVCSAPRRSRTPTPAPTSPRPRPTCAPPSISAQRVATITARFATA